MGIPSKGEILVYWKDWLIEYGFDINEPTCWACGTWWDDKYDIKKVYASMEEIKEHWNRAPLQRCHIIPKSLGGSDDVSNLFLMCSECHDLAPDTTSREMFFKWVNTQNWLKRKFDRLKDALDSFGLNEKDVEELAVTLATMKDKKVLSEKMGIHFNQNGKGSEFSISSFIAAILEYQKENFKE